MKTALELCHELLMASIVGELGSVEVDEENGRACRDPKGDPVYTPTSLTVNVKRGMAGWCIGLIAGLCLVVGGGAVGVVGGMKIARRRRFWRRAEAALNEANDEGGLGYTGVDKAGLLENAH